MSSSISLSLRDVMMPPPESNTPIRWMDLYVFCQSVVECISTLICIVRRLPQNMLHSLIPVQVGERDQFECPIGM